MMIYAKAIAAVLLVGNLASFLIVLRMYLESREQRYLWIMGVQVVMSTVLLGVVFYQRSNDRRAEFYTRRAAEAKAKKSAAAAQRLANLEQAEQSPPQ
jgi:hypothetical protein